jgi:transcriptional regulator with XRE-family HTH domain
MDKKRPIVLFLETVMKLRRLLPSQLAADLGISHTTVIRWLKGKHVPDIQSCERLAEYGNTSVERILRLAGHIPEGAVTQIAGLPEFREYAKMKYPKELDEDIVIMIEDLIERRRMEGK